LTILQWKVGLFIFSISDSALDTNGVAINLTTVLYSDRYLYIVVRSQQSLHQGWKKTRIFFYKNSFFRFSRVFMFSLTV